MNGQQVTGRSGQSVAILPRLAWALFLAFAICVGSVRFGSNDVLNNGPLGPVVRIVVRAVLLKYWPIRVWTLDHVALVACGALGSVALIILVVRSSILLWHNEVVPRLSGTRFKAEELQFPSANY